MKELSREILLRYLDAMRSQCVVANWDGQAEQAYQQIRKLLDKKGKEK